MENEVLKYNAINFLRAIDIRLTMVDVDHFLEMDSRYK